MELHGDPLAPLRADLPRAGVFVDFDGTLSPIVLDPDAARPLPGAVELLVALSSRLGQLAVVSGRPVAFLTRHLPPQVDAVGLYGLEARRGGVLVEHPAAPAWRSVVDDAVATAVEALPTGVEVEHKGLSLTLHTRARPELAEAAAAWAAEASERTGLELRPAKQSVELHPPVPVDKGTVVDELAEGLAAIAYLGDDAGDLSAFAALDRFAAAGGAAVRVAVTSEEVPPELVAASDVQVEGPEGCLALLATLLDQ